MSTLQPQRLPGTSPHICGWPRICFYRLSARQGPLCRHRLSHRSPPRKVGTRRASKFGPGNSDHAACRAAHENNYLHSWHRSLGTAVRRAPAFLASRKPRPCAKSKHRPTRHHSTKSEARARSRSSLGPRSGIRSRSSCCIKSTSSSRVSDRPRNSHRRPVACHGTVQRHGHAHQRSSAFAPALARPPARHGRRR